MIYLDWAATSPPLPTMLNDMNKYSAEYYGNPSSLHREGKKAAVKLENMRKRCASVLNTTQDSLVFTSGGTEANNMIISSLYQQRDKGRIIISGLEHPSLWNPVQALAKFGWEIKVLNPGSDGIIRPKKLTKLLTSDTKMVIIIGVHNESGVIQPLKSLIETVRDFDTPRPIHFHSDMIQWLGKIPLNLQEFDLDSASFAAHKFQGPRGVGMLYQKKPQAGLYAGGGQEKGLRPGTENIGAIAGMTRALEETSSKLVEESLSAQTRMRQLILGIQQIPGLKIIPDERLQMEDHFSPWILNCTLPPLPGEVLVRAMDEQGFAISTGSACSSKKKSRTRGLESMGIDSATAFSSIRISQGPSTSSEEIERFIHCLKEQSALLGRAVR